jgi:hypothetical protein
MLATVRECPNATRHDGYARQIILKNLQRAETGRDALMVLFRYVSMVADQLGVQRFQQVVHQVLPEAEDSLMTIAEEMRQLAWNKAFSRDCTKGNAPC